MYLLGKNKQTKPHCSFKGGEGKGEGEGQGEVTLYYHNDLQNLSLDLAQLHFIFKVILEDRGYF